jgi:cellulose synthase/poly-beta-1,6-N-acetylglucosamine synthase-like glycosyltransferase
MLGSSIFLFLSFFQLGMPLPLLESKKKTIRFSNNLKIAKLSECSSGKEKYHYDIGSRDTNPLSILSDKCCSIPKNNKLYNAAPDNLKKKLPFVSIIIPVRNEEKYIERCILSILAQDYPYFDLIIVDDNSTDNTLKVINKIKNNNNYKSIGLPVDRLKIISLKNKPDGWTGKTWASEQGFLESKGSILLFTDGDTNYLSRDVISQSVFYMQNNNLDVLTGIPSSEKLSNFWSKISIPFWESVFALFGVNSSKVNDPSSKIAYLIGCYFLIKRSVFVEIGTFEVVHNAIQEDKAMGVLLKERGYKLKLVKLKEMVSTLWADDLKSLWYGIGRTLAPLVLKNKIKISFNLFILFFATVLPFIIFPFIITSVYENYSEMLKPPLDFNFYLLAINAISCIVILFLFSLKCKEYKIPVIFSLTAFFGSLFVFIACMYNVIPLLFRGKTKSILWQGRYYTYRKEHQGFTI